MDYLESQCSHCPKVFTSETGLKKHKFENHYAVENGYDCEQCGKEFQSKLFKIKYTCESSGL